LIAWFLVFISFCWEFHFNFESFPILRCIFININPESAERHPQHEPLKTLKSYRKFAKTGENPVMGIHLGLREKGSIRLGDSVYVEA
jgi:hypothetical protein